MGAREGRGAPYEEESAVVDTVLPLGLGGLCVLLGAGALIAVGVEALPDRSRRAETADAPGQGERP